MRRRLLLIACLSAIALLAGCVRAESSDQISRLSTQSMTDATSLDGSNSESRGYIQYDPP